MYFLTYVKIQAMFFIWNPIAEAVNCGCMGKSWVFYTSRHYAGLPYILIIQGFSNTLLIPSLPLSFFFLFIPFFFLLCTIFALHTTFKISLVLRVSSKPSREANACPTVSVPADSVSTQGYLDAFTGRIDSDFSLLISLLFLASTNAILLHPLKGLLFARGNFVIPLR